MSLWGIFKRTKLYCFCNGQSTRCNNETGQCFCGVGSTGFNCSMCFSNYFEGDPTKEGGHCYFLASGNTIYELTLTQEVPKRYYRFYPPRRLKGVNITFSSSGKNFESKVLLTLIATNEYGKTNTIVFQEVSFYSEYISYDRAFANAPPLSFDLELLLASPHENDAVDAILLCSYNLPEKSVAQLLIPFFLIFFGSTLLILLCFKICVYYDTRRRKIKRKRLTKALMRRPYSSLAVNNELTPSTVSLEYLKDNETAIKTILIELPASADLRFLAFGCSLVTVAEDS
ncbi:attractin-like isoform X2 [Zophobas morio]|uniref:attractin-like isoform X2 n=1 Tax=Zophobas morio TaxID=2755281 RepID=UPI003083A650